jgi:hypothetical protein
MLYILQELVGDEDTILSMQYLTCEARSIEYLPIFRYYAKYELRDASYVNIISLIKIR